MGESEKAKALRIRREEAVRQILAGERTGSDVAKDWKVSRQAVSLWVQRYREQGSLVPGKRGRKKLVPFTEMQKGMFFHEVLTRYKKLGYKLGDEIPRRDCIEPKDLKEALSEFVGKSCSTTRTKGLMRELGLPLYLDPPEEPLESEEEDEWEEEDFEYFPQYLRDPSDTRREPPPPPEEPRPAGKFGDGDYIPKTPEEYEKWIEETQAMMKGKGVHYDPMHLGAGEAQGPRVRTGKHAKNKRQGPNKRKKKGGKKRR